MTRVEHVKARPGDGAWTGFAFCIAVLAAWFWFLHNRHFSIHEGWFTEYARLMRDGQMPYRDFYFFTQPMSAWISRAVLAISDKLIYMRYYGVLERLAIAALLYAILKRHFSGAASACGVLASSFLFVTYISDAFYSYLYHCLLFALAALLCVQQALWSPRVQSRRLWMGAAGVAAAFCFFSKQSNGLLIAFAIGLGIAVVAASWRSACVDLAYYGAGILAGSAPFVWWIASNGAWTPYVQQVFVGAAASKGSLFNIAFAFLEREFEPVSLILFGLLIVLPLWIAARRGVVCWADGPEERLPVYLGVTASVLLTAVMLPVVLRHFEIEPMKWIHFAARLTARFAMYATVGAAVWLAAKRLAPRWKSMRDLSLADQALAIFLLFCLAWTWGCGMSFAVEQQSLIPGLAAIIAILYDRVRIGPGRAGAWTAVALTCAAMLLGIAFKWNIAFSWMGWRQPVTVSGYHSSASEISDYVLTQEEHVLFDSIFEAERRYLGPGDVIVTFPSIPIFNIVANRHQPFFAPVHCWDVCPDRIAAGDAARLRKIRPRMIVELDFDEWIWQSQETAFRGNGKSGQREMQSVIRGLTSSGEYRLLGEYRTPYFSQPVRAWVRESPASPAQTGAQ